MTINADIFKKINESMNTFSKSQRRIAEYILNNFDKAPFITAAKLASEVDTSESTVVRFALDLGYEGFPEMSKAMQEQAINSLTAIQRLKASNEIIDKNDVLRSVLKADVQRIRNTIDLMDKETFDKAIDKLLQAKRIYIIGVRSSAALAIHMAFYFNIIFDDVHLVQTISFSEIFEQILNVSEGDAVIGISFPRYSTRTAKAMEYSGKRGAYVIAITDSVNSPVAKWADSTLTAKSDMTSFIDSLTAPMSLINALMVACALKKESKVTETLITLEKIWDEYQVYEKEKKNIEEK